MSLLEPPQGILSILRNCDGVSEEEMGPEVLGYVAFLAAGLADSFQFDAQVWEAALAPYLMDVVGDTTDLVEGMRAATQASTVEDDDAESYGDNDDGAEELTNIRFNLAYGGKILLHQTKLRLLRGHRYGLIGQNGAGKTTLMTAICAGKLDGWPNHLITAYVDSGSNVDPVHEAKPVLEYLIQTTKRNEADCKAMLETLKFTPDMQDGTIGALSGGWQMKLRLIGAVLLQADILLLDEPVSNEKLSTSLTVQSHRKIRLIQLLIHFVFTDKSPRQSDCQVADRLSVWPHWDHCDHCQSRCSIHGEHLYRYYPL